MTQSKVRRVSEARKGLEYLVTLNDTIATTKADKWVVNASMTGCYRPGNQYLHRKLANNGSTS
jgi:hypothetical protein